MLTLVTGNPGNGKTLYTLQEVEKLRLESSRAVYQHGIVGLVKPWLELKDPHDWYELPHGSIIVIDEAWKPFPVRKQGSEPPKCIAEFATHRHHGFDIFLVTQHRHQIDTFVRKMVGRHIHLVRKFGTPRANVFQWEAETDATNTKAQEVAIKTDWAYPTDVYDWYKSAEVHTVQKDFPWRKFWWLWVLIGCLCFAIPYAIYRVLHLVTADKVGIKTAVTSVEGGGPGPGGGVVFGHIWRPDQAVPRADFVRASAPRYDSISKLTTAPYLSGCMSMSRGAVVTCTCTDQAGAHIDMPVLECEVLIKQGWFDPTRSYADVKEANIAFLNSQSGSASGSSGSASSGSHAVGSAAVGPAAQ